MLAGLATALNYGKLPPALSAMQQEFALTLVQVSWMVSLFTLGGALFGIVGGSIADRVGAHRVMALGLLLTGMASALGTLATTPALLFASRGIESIGFLLAVLPGPALLRRCVPAASLRGWLGIWGAYMPAGMSLALVSTPWLMAIGGWRLAWWIASITAVIWAAVIVLVLPRQAPSVKAAAAAHPVASSTLAHNVLATAGSGGPWLLALCFLFYAGQFVAIFSFLPSVYAQAGVATAVGALLTAAAVLANVIGNLASGVLLQRGFQRHSLIASTGCAMAFTAWLAFGSEAPFVLRYAAIVVLSATGGLIPGTLFASAPFYAPNASAVSTTVGLMQQGSSVGQLLLPPLVAALAQYSGGWSSTWMITGAAALATVALAMAIRRHDRRRPGLGH